MQPVRERCESRMNADRCNSQTSLCGAARAAVEVASMCKTTRTRGRDEVAVHGVGQNSPAVYIIRMHMVDVLRSGLHAGSGRRRLHSEMETPHVKARAASQCWHCVVCRGRVSHWQVVHCTACHATPPVFCLEYGAQNVSLQGWTLLGQARGRETKRPSRWTRLDHPRSSMQQQ